MHLLKTVSPTGSYKIDIPAESVENIEERVYSYWNPNENVLLQISSYLRTAGQQVSARERLNDRLAIGALANITHEKIGPKDCPDVAAASGVDEEGISWFYCYAVWEDLTVFVTISGSIEELKISGGWAFNALRSLRRQ